MRTLLRRTGAALALPLLVAGLDARALNVTLGDVRANNLGSYGFTATNSVLSFDGGATDQLYQMFGYLGNASDTVAINGTYFSVASAIAQLSPGVAGSSLLLNATGAGALGLASGSVRIDYTFTLVDDASASDRDSFLWDVAITNLGAAPVSLSMYQYMDLDLNGTANNDVANANLSQMVVSDSTAPFTFRWSAANGGTADHFAVGGYPTVRNLLDGMAAAADLSDSAASFGPGDFTGAFQYDFTLAPGATHSLAGGAIAVPEPGPMVLAMFGIMGLAAASRPRPRQRRSRAV